MALLQRYPVTGADNFDLPIVATKLATSVQRIYKFNAAAFEFFPRLKC